MSVPLTILRTCMTLNNDLNILADWFRANKLSLNTTKTNYIPFSKHNKTIDTGIHKLYLNGDNINKLDSTRFLGLIIDQHLEWDEHLKMCSSKMASGVYAINTHNTHNHVLQHGTTLLNVWITSMGIHL